MAVFMTGFGASSVRFGNGRPTGALPLESCRRGRDAEDSKLRPPSRGGGLVRTRVSTGFRGRL